jgi:hypothetical protein
MRLHQKGINCTSVQNPVLDALAVRDRLDERPVAVSPAQRSTFALDSNDLHRANGVYVSSWL